MTKFITKFAIAATAFTAFASVAHADSRAINIGDRDLTQPGAVAQLKAEIRAAAHSICHMGDNSDTVAFRAKKECYVKAVADADARIDTVLALQAGKSAEREALASAKGSTRTVR
jgi:UrcA family protein